MNKQFKLTGRSLLLIAMACAVTPAYGLKRVAQGNMVFIEQQGFIGWNGPIEDGQASTSADGLVDGFSVAAAGTAIEDTPAGEAIKFMQAGDWLSAIAAIEKLNTDDPRLVTDPNGILRPLSTFKSALIASMPAEGQSTFRKLNNPAADTRLAQAIKLTDLTEREKAYQSLVKDYALCDAAAQAADALGDLRFEQGRFDEAAALFMFAAEHPAGTADDPMVMAKRLLALSRAGLWKRFDELAQYANFRHAATSVKLGGSDIALPALIEQLSATRKAGDINIVNQPDRLVLPRFDQPVRVFNQPLLNQASLQNINQAAMNNGMGGAIQQLIKPVTAIDNDRIFTLALGSVARLDPQTGSDLWRQGNTDEHLKVLTGRMHQLQQGYQQALVIAGDTLLAVVPDDNYLNRSRLIAYNTQTGEQRWSTEGNSELRNQGIIGQPIAFKDQVYFVTQQPGEAQIKLVAVTLEGGRFVRSLDLGTAPMDPNMGAPIGLSPRLTMGQGYLFVQTNNGSLIAIDPYSFTFAWAYSQRIRPGGMGMNMGRRRGMVANASTATTYTGTVIAHEGLVFAKDTRSNNLHAFREYDASPVWSARTDSDATIVHFDERHVYVLGEELVAHDRLTGERVWWTPFAGGDAGKPVFTDNACLIAGNQRICRVDLTTGKLTDYSDELAGGADLAVIGNNLIHTTDNDITGYRLPQPIAPRPNN